MLKGYLGIKNRDKLNRWTDSLMNCMLKSDCGLQLSSQNSCAENVICKGKNELILTKLSATFSWLQNKIDAYLIGIFALIQL